MGFIDRILTGGHQPPRPHLTGSEHMRRGESYLAAAEVDKDPVRQTALATIGDGHINAARLAFEIQQAAVTGAVRNEWQTVLQRSLPTN